MLGLQTHPASRCQLPRWLEMQSFRRQAEGLFLLRRRQAPWPRRASSFVHLRLSSISVSRWLRLNHHQDFEDYSTISSQRNALLLARCGCQVATDLSTATRWNHPPLRLAPSLVSYALLQYFTRSPRELRLPFGVCIRISAARCSRAARLHISTSSSFNLRPTDAGKIA